MYATCAHIMSKTIAVLNISTFFISKESIIFAKKSLLKNFYAFNTLCRRQMKIR